MDHSPMLLNVAEIYARGVVEFMGVEFRVAPGVLVPREETELLGRAALEAIAELGLASPRVVDMCCGAGNLACSIARYVPGAQVWASDLTRQSVAVALDNVRKLGLGTRVRVQQGNLFAGLKALGLEGTVDIIVCNPPYISRQRLQGDRAHLLEHEPREAFDGGPYGFDIHLRVLKDARHFLRPGGVLLFEIGLGQERQVHKLFERALAYDDLRQLTDRSGAVRVVRGRRQFTQGNPKTRD